MPKPGIISTGAVDTLTAAPDDNGPFALFEFSGALPRAKLFAHWQISINNEATLEQLASPAFDPNQMVLVAGGLPDAIAATDTNQNAGTVDFAKYER